MRRSNAFVTLAFTPAVCKRNTTCICLYFSFLGGWPFIFRCANLPDGLSTHMSNCHLSLLSANEYWQHDKESGGLRRNIRAPKSLKPHLTVIVDDLIGAYTRGVRCVDSSVPTHLEGHKFRCRVCLLFWTGDYPAQAAVSGTHSKTCHWCCKKSKPSPEISRRVWDGYRKFLPKGHDMREASAFYGPEENDDIPAPRTPAEFAEQVLI